MITMSNFEAIVLAIIVVSFLTFMHLATRKGDGSSDRDVN